MEVKPTQPEQYLSQLQQQAQAQAPPDQLQAMRSSAGGLNMSDLAVNTYHRRLKAAADCLLERSKEAVLARRRSERVVDSGEASLTERVTFMVTGVPDLLYVHGLSRPLHGMLPSLRLLAQEWLQDEQFHAPGRFHRSERIHLPGQILPRMLWCRRQPGCLAMLSQQF